MGRDQKIGRGGLGPRDDDNFIKTMNFIQSIRKHAATGDPGSQYILAHYLASRPDANHFRQECLKLLRTLSSQGNNLAQYALGNWYGYGLGVRKNFKIANVFFLKAATLGHPIAQFNMAVSLEKGKGIKKNLQKAVQWYRRSAQGGDRQAQTELGRCHFYGIGVRRNYKKAVFWFKKSAKRGDPDALRTLGYCYSKGLGVNKEPLRAKYYYSQADKKSKGKEGDVVN